MTYLCITGVQGGHWCFGYVKSLILKNKIVGLGMVSFINTIVLDAVSTHILNNASLGHVALIIKVLSWHMSLMTPVMLS